MLLRPTKYSRVIRQYWRPHGVKYLSRTSTSSTHRALIAHALPIQYTESRSALDQLMDGLNGFGPTVGVSSQARCSGGA
jgi:hypothetical protein